MKHRTGYLFKRGDTWYVQWRLDGKLFSKSLRTEDGQAITSKREAEEARDRFMAPMAMASEAESLRAIVARADTIQAAVDATAKALTLSAAWSSYLASGKRPDTGPDTLAVYEGQFGQFTDWLQEKHPDVQALRDVTEAIAGEYAGYLNHGRLNPNTFNKHIRVLRLVYRVLFKQAGLTCNPWEEIATKKLETVSRRELTFEELQKVCQSATGDLRPLLALGVYTGLRLRDCTTLRWGEVDLVRGIIRRVPHKTARSKPGRFVQIPIHPVLRAEIVQLQRGSNDFLLPQLATDYAAGGTSKRRVIDRIQDHFVSQGVSIYAPGTGPDTGKRAVVEIGFHSLRHSFVSMCRANNVPLSVVEALVGHSNPAMTKHYTHTGELAAGNAIASLPAVVGDVQPEPKKRDAEAILREIGAIVAGITSQNWQEKKAALLAWLLSLQPKPTRQPKQPRGARISRER